MSILIRRLTDYRIVNHFTREREDNREVKHDVYGKRQTAKMKLLPSRFSCVYSSVKLFVFAMNNRRRFSIFVCFINGLGEKNSKSEFIFAVCRLPLTSCLTSLIINCEACISWGSRTFTLGDSVTYPAVL